MVEVLVPLHVTGFFKPHFHENPLLAGSVGAGFSFTVFSRTLARRNNQRCIRIFINGREATREALTSVAAAEEFFTNAEFFEGVDIYHEIPAPVACGLSTSGAGALGVVFALNELFDTGFDRLRLAQMAHVAEVRCRTGLGSVIAQYEGKFEVRLRPGAPGIGVVSRFDVDAEVAIVVFGEIKTSTILSSNQAMKRVIEAFGDMNERLAREFSVEKFCELSKRFALTSGLMSENARRALEIAERVGLRGSMLMLGDGVFLFGEKLRERVRDLLKVMPRRPIWWCVARIASAGVRLQ